MTGRPPGFVHRFVPAPASDSLDTLSQNTLLLLHGTGGDENDLLSLGSQIAPQAAQLSPRGPVLEHGMPRFFRRLAEGVFDVPDLRRRTQELANFVTNAAAAYGFAPGRVTAVGFSNGANIAAALLLLAPGVLSAAILFHPMVPLVPDPLPFLAGTPVLIAAGRRDPLVPPDETERLAALLRRAGSDVTLGWHDGGHALSRAEVEEAAMWYASLTH